MTEKIMPTRARDGSNRPQLRAVGERAVLLDCGSLKEAMLVFAALAAAVEAGALEVDELVPAAETVLVVGGEAARPRAFADRLNALLAAHEETPSIKGETAETVIPVVYDGEDLVEVAALTGMSVDQVIARHLAPTYLGAFTGFSPGFAYLSGGDPALVVPRRATPRPRIPAGSVGLGGSFTGIYPRESPGGWQLLGHTNFLMWDLNRAQPAAVVPGGRVRFVAERDRVEAAPDRTTPVERPAPTRVAGSVPVFRVIDAGLQTLFQDGGRPGLASLGVSPSGAADRGALERANRMAGNDVSAAVLELSHGGFAVEVLATSVIALSGATRTGQIDGPWGARQAPHGMPFRVDPGETLRLDPAVRGLRTVLAVRGGVCAPEVLGSASRDTLAGIGPDPVRPRDTVYSGAAPAAAVGFPEAQLTELPAPGSEIELGIVPGPRGDWFDDRAWTQLCETSWEVSPRSDRVGVRLAGEALRRADGFDARELPSEGATVGALQVPPDGQPVLFLADHPLTGGYPVIAVVRDRDLDLAAQLPPGARVRFTIAKENER